MNRYSFGGAGIGRQHGLSLVELMVAVTLGLVISAVIFSVFINSRQGYRAQDGSALMQDNARFALETLSRAIRESGFFNGSVPNTFVWAPASLNNPNAANCSDAWIANARVALRGYEGAAASPLAQPCVLATYVANTDVLVVRNANPNSAPGTGYIPDAAALPNNLLFRGIPRGVGVIFNADQNNAARAAVANQGDAQGVFTWRFQTRVFSVAVPAEPMMGAVLYNYSPHHGNPASQPVIDGIETLRFVYGLDLNGDRSADTWLRADQVGNADANWDNIVAVRIGLVVRGNAMDGFQDDRTYDLPGGRTYVPPAADQRFPRRLYVHDVQVRNRTRN